MSTSQGSQAVLKVLGNREGPTHLAKEYVGTALARLFKLLTFDFCITHIDKGLASYLCESMPEAERYTVVEGPAFCTRYETGAPWDGELLDDLLNPYDVVRLVLFDTWIRNRDRHPPPDSDRKPNLGNVWLSRDELSGDQRLLKAIDHTHAMCCQGLKKLGLIDYKRDDRLYGLFPGFRTFCTQEAFAEPIEDLKKIGNNKRSLQDVVSEIPTEWEVEDSDKVRWVEFLGERARYIAETFDPTLQKYQGQGGNP